MKYKQAIVAIGVVTLMCLMSFVTNTSVYGYSVNGQEISCEGVDPALCPTGHINEEWPQDIVTSVISWLMYAAGAVAVVLMIIGGLRYILAAGNEQQVAGAKKMIIGSLIGLGIVILSLAIIQLVKYALGVD